jgi:hypothetical protein
LLIFRTMLKNEFVLNELKLFALNINYQ